MDNQATKLLTPQEATMTSTSQYTINKRGYRLDEIGTSHPDDEWLLIYKGKELVTIVDSQHTADKLIAALEGGN